MNNEDKKEYRTLRLLITNKCSLSCNYCCAEGHASQYNHMNADNIGILISVFNQLFNIKRIKLTGGEPLDFSGIDNVIDSIYKLKEDDQVVSIVTNGVNTLQISSLLKYKDIDITISLPSLDENIFHLITNSGEYYNNVINSISILDNNNFPYKINCVLVDGVTNTQSNILDLINRFNRHNVKLRFLELSENAVNRKKLSSMNYKTTAIIFQNYIESIGFAKCIDSDLRESVLYAKDGMCIKYIKYFCEDNCRSCPQNKTSLWVSCDGYLMSCSHDSNKAIQISKFTYDEIYDCIRKNLNRL